MVVPELPLACLSVKSAHFSGRLLLLQRPNSRRSFAHGFSPWLYLHPHCTEAGTFIPEICGIGAYPARETPGSSAMWSKNSAAGCCLALFRSPVTSQPALWFAPSPLSSQTPASESAFARPIRDEILLFSAAFSLGGIPHYGAVAECKSVSPFVSTTRTQITK